MVAYLKLSRVVNLEEEKFHPFLILDKINSITLKLKIMFFPSWKMLNMHRFTFFVSVSFLEMGVGAFSKELKILVKKESVFHHQWVKFVHLKNLKNFRFTVYLSKKEQKSFLRIYLKMFIFFLIFSSDCLFEGIPFLKHQMFMGFRYLAANTF